MELLFVCTNEKVFYDESFIDEKPSKKSMSVIKKAEKGKGSK